MEAEGSQHRYLPDINRISVLEATILLAYALTPFVNIPEKRLTFSALGIVFDYRLNFTWVVSIVVAALAAAGVDWLISGHPKGEKRLLAQHWILPALTAWVIGVPLNMLKVSREWWAIFALGGLLLLLVFIAEYIVVDLQDERHTPAVVGLTAVSFGMFLFLAVAIRSAGLRLYTAVPLLVFSMGLVGLRTLYLRLGGKWTVSWALGIGIVTGQFALGLHYLPLTPQAFGLLLLGPAYALTSVAGSIEEERPWQSAWMEPAFMIIILWGLAFFLNA